MSCPAVLDEIDNGQLITFALFRLKIKQSSLKSILILLVHKNERIYEPTRGACNPEKNSQKTVQLTG